MTAVTGARAELSLLVDLPRQRLWERVTDVVQYGTWSPECVHTQWLGAAAGRPARVGDRFAARNRFATGLETSVVCVVTDLAAPEMFGWQVLDDDGVPASIWRYQLTTVGRRTRLRHSFEHGPGQTWVRLHPDELHGRLAELRTNMADTLAAMLAGEDYTSEDHTMEGDLVPTRLLAQMTVSDLTASVEWYTGLFGRDPDARPMDGLVEWHLADTFGVQVWAEPDRAGHSSMVLDKPDLDGYLRHLDDAGIDHPDPQDATSSRILPLTDPDGNRIVITGPFTP